MGGKAIAPILSIFCVLSCAQKIDVVDRLELAPSSIKSDFESRGGTVAVTVESSTHWDAVVSGKQAGWLSVYPSSGESGKISVAITAERNDVTVDRSAVIKFTAGKAGRELTVRQLSADLLSWNLSKEEMPAEGGLLTLQVSANVDYSVEVSKSCSSWLTSYENKSISITGYHFNVAANQSDEDRTGEIVIRSGKGSQQVRFIQKGDQGSILKAEGYVRFTDGSPAGGVVVSDGFHCAVTDADGHYCIYPTSDCRYIYISFPADCRITLNQYGQPDFFKKYLPEQRRYDFSLEKAQVENEFTLFALADPQAHFTTRGHQKRPDTERFRLETVPALNSATASSSLPCYGITLGDIVHSVNMRDSSPGLPIMRSLFASLNMPVFQTMGNHDFTYFYTTKPLETDPTSSTLHLKAQRAFEDCFGPVNYSFNRGKAHIVCMRNIIYDSKTDNMDIHGGFSDEQYQWLKEDLSSVGKDRMVILCVHIPLASCTNGEHRKDIVSLISKYTNSTIFSGHLHCSRTYTEIQSTYMTEHIHQAVCGELWYSCMNSDGCPNGYTTYHVKGNKIVGSRLRGINGPMSDPDYQMRIYRGNMKTGGPGGWFQWKQGRNTLMINVFNGSREWKVQVYENGEYTGDASYMDKETQWFDSIEAGKTYDVDNSSSQDWWTIGCHLGYMQYGTVGTSFFGTCYHMFRYTLKKSNPSVKVVATDLFGTKYECSTITEECYPDYVVTDNVI